MTARNLVGPRSHINRGIMITPINISYWLLRRLFPLLRSVWRLLVTPDDNYFIYLTRYARLESLADTEISARE